MSLLLTSVAVIIASIALALLARAFDPGYRLHIGNTGGSLTTLIEIDDSRILVGAGPTRSHAADFIGRSTRPWDREIDLLILPGWDDHHAVGALGLLERRDVNGVAVVGLPGEDPVWTMLERRAQRDDVPVRFLESSHRVNIGDVTRIKMSELAGQQTGAWIRLEHAGVRVDILDTSTVREATPPATAFSSRNEHVLINVRTQNAPELTQPALLVQPRPFWQGDFDESVAKFVSEIDRNDRIQITLEDNALRLPLDYVNH